MSLPLPTWYPRPPAGQPPSNELKPTHLPSGLSSVELARETGMKINAPLFINTLPYTTALSAII